jgi:hypothetical protein
MAVGEPYFWSTELSRRLARYEVMENVALAVMA